ncbi:MAG: HAD-IIA family hydrolase [Actinomycetota bacterium]
MTEATRAPQSVVCLDLDGVVWRGDDPVPGSADAVLALRSAGLLVGFMSNNSSMPVDHVVAKLARCGIEAAPEEVLTSALAAADLLAADLAPGARVLVCAGPGVVESLTHAGFEAVWEPPAAAVVVGFHRDFDFEGLERAARAVREGARFVATNLDATYPVSGGLLPGAGSLVAAVATASGCAPEVAGKPCAPAAEMVHHRLGPRGVMVGDRPTTDGDFARRLGWPFALVLTGVAAHAPGPGEEPVPDPPPDYLADDLAALVPALVADLAG